MVKENVFLARALALAAEAPPPFVHTHVEEVRARHAPVTSPPVECARCRALVNRCAALEIELATLRLQKGLLKNPAPPNYVAAAMPLNRIEDGKCE
jgi:hypothetical protein